MFKLEKCCCCLSLRTGCLVIAALSIVGNLAQGFELSYK